MSFTHFTTAERAKSKKKVLKKSPGIFYSTVLPTMSECVDAFLKYDLLKSEHHHPIWTPRSWTPSNGGIKRQTKMLTKNAALGYQELKYLNHRQGKFFAAPNSATRVKLIKNTGFTIGHLFTSHSSSALWSKTMNNEAETSSKKQNHQVHEVMNTCLAFLQVSLPWLNKFK